MIYKQLKKMLGVLEITEVMLLSVSRDRCKVMREIVLPFQLRGVSYTQKVLVAKMGVIDLLLGVDFLYKNGAVIDLQNSQLLLPDQKVPICSHKLTSFFPVKLAKRSKVGAWRLNGVSSSCDNWPDGQPVLFESMVILGREVALPYLR
jgi:hypothetical protein